MSRRRFSVNDLVPSQSEACDASVPGGAKMPKRAAQSDEKCRTPKVVRNKNDLSERKISRSKLNRKQEDGKNCRPFLSAQFIARCAVFIGWVR